MRSRRPGKSAGNDSISARGHSYFSHVRMQLSVYQGGGGERRYLRADCCVADRTCSLEETQHRTRICKISASPPLQSQLRHILPQCHPRSISKPEAQELLRASPRPSQEATPRFPAGDSGSSQSEPHSSKRAYGATLACGNEICRVRAGDPAPPGHTRPHVKASTGVSMRKTCGSILGMHKSTIRQEGKRGRTEWRTRFPRLRGFAGSLLGTG